MIRCGGSLRGQDPYHVSLQRVVKVGRASWPGEISTFWHIQFTIVPIRQICTPTIDDGNNFCNRVASSRNSLFRRANQIGLANEKALEIDPFLIRDLRMMTPADDQSQLGSEERARSVSAIEARTDVLGASPNQSAQPRRISPIAKTLVGAILFVVAYVGFQRIGTTANADSVEFTRNLAGGFLAVGMTEDQPGFIVLSALDQEQVDVSAAQTKNRLAGTHTVVEVETPIGTTRTRLRGPQVILISEEGVVVRQDVSWTVAEFNVLREAADCSHEAATKKHRCGAPFADLQEVFAEWPCDRVPERVRAFVEPFKSHRSRHKYCQ